MRDSEAPFIILAGILIIVMLVGLLALVEAQDKTIKEFQAEAVRRGIMVELVDVHGNSTFVWEDQINE